VRYTQKQIDKYNRQKYIVELEKISKNLFRMFRDEKVSAEDFVRKFKQRSLMKKQKFSLNQSIISSSKSISYGFISKHVGLKLLQIGSFLISVKQR